MYILISVAFVATLREYMPFLGNWEVVGMGMVRYQMFIDEGQKKVLEDLHQRMNVPVAELVRRAIDGFIGSQNSSATYPQADEQTKDLLALAGVCEGGPADLADSHDQHLYGGKPS